jgi:hypothetical protein
MFLSINKKVLNSIYKIFIKLFIRKEEIFFKTTKKEVLNISQVPNELNKRKFLKGLIS